MLNIIQMLGAGIIGGMAFLGAYAFVENAFQDHQIALVKQGFYELAETQLHVCERK